MPTIIIPQKYCGPPTSGNGGYVAGLLARLAGGHRAVAMRAPIPLDRPLDFDTSTEPARLLDGETLVAEAIAADRGALPDVPVPPTLAEARAAGARYVGTAHPICLCCSEKLGVADGLRIQTGQLEGQPAGTLAGVWTVDPAFADADGTVPDEFVWTAIDCPGFYAWVAVDGPHRALTGTMQAEMLERPRVGEDYIVMAWPWEKQSERKCTSGVALFTADGRLIARGYHVWIRPRPAA